MSVCNQRWEYMTHVGAKDGLSFLFLKASSQSEVDKSSVYMLLHSM